MLKVQHVTLADQDPFIWTLPTPGDAHLAFVLGQPAAVAARIVVEPRCAKDFYFSFLSQTYTCSIKKIPDFFQSWKCILLVSKDEKYTPSNSPSEDLEQPS